MKSLLLFCLFIFSFVLHSFGQQGKDGDRTIAAANTIVNEYTALTADASVGSNQISVSNNNLNTNNRFPNALAAGDLIMIIQVQGATVGGSFYTDVSNTFGLPKDSTWGSILNLNNCGNYEIKEVSSVLGTNTIQLNCALQNDYLVSGKTIVVRIPRYNNLSVSGSITCTNWNGTIGGIVALEAIGNILINGQISANAKGFRGGATDNQTTPGSGDVASNSGVYGANRGEGIAGFGTDLNYVGGRFGKGTAANAGGGGTAQNAGGGGGANGGNVLNWNAYGIPDLSNASWASAWNLLFTNFANNNSSGGGLGGYSASTNQLNPLTNGPNNYNWSGDGRRNQGGYGGRPLDYSNGKLFFGGAGGAGDGDDNFSGRGGNAGGLIYVFCKGTISGIGVINANGEAGANSSGTPTLTGIAGQDGAGGGGAGGTIFIDGTTTISGITITATGGNGGSQILSRGTLNSNNNWNVQAQGPGGGGGGGFIKTPSNTIATNILGGINGTTNSISMVNFPANGATKGGAGTVEQITIDNFIALNDTICAGTTAVLSVTSSNLNNAIEWYDADVGGNLLFTGSTFITPVLNSNQTYFAQQCPNFYRLPVSAIIQTNSIVVDAGIAQQICGVQTQLNATLPLGYSGQWTVVSGNANFSLSSSPNTNVNNLNIGTNVLRWTITDGICSTGFSDITIESFSSPTIADAGNNVTQCINSISLIGNTPIVGSGSWQVIAGSSNLDNTNSAICNASNLQFGNNLFVYTISSGNICPNTTDTLLVQVFAQPDVAIAGNDQQICSNFTQLSSNIPTVGVGIWSLISGNGNFSNVSSNSTNVSNISAGVNVFRWTISTANCGSSFDEVSIEVINAPNSAFAGNDNEVCGDSITLNASAASSGNGVWTALNSGPVFSDVNLFNSVVSNLSQGTNTFVWTVTLSGCPETSDTIIISSVFPPTIANAGLDQIICGNTTIVTGSVVFVGNSSWTSSNSNVVINNSTSNITSMLFNQTGTYTLSYSISNGICPTSTDEIQIEINPSLVANAGPDILACDSSINLSNTGTFGNILWSSSPVSFPITFSSANNQNTSAFVAEPSIGFAILTVSYPGCESQIDSLVVNIVTKPIADAGNNFVSCDGSVLLNANLENGATGAWENISNNFLPSQISNPNSSFSFADTGNVFLIWKVQIPSCPIATDTIKIYFTQPSSIKLASNDTLISAGDKVQLNVNEGLNVVWQSTPNLSCFECNNPIAFPNSDELFFVTYEDKNNCTYLDTVEVKVEKNFYAEIPTAFSPNNNGVNDFLYIRSNGLKSLQFEVFNEYGQKVFYITEGESFDKKWDGTFNDSQLVPQVLIYSLNGQFIDGSIVSKKGKLMLMR
jgi:gliding motility-associated-like protein